MGAAIPADFAATLDLVRDIGFDQSWPLARTHVFARLLHREVHGERIHAVNLPRRKVEAQRAS
jgi:hypothetical protein